jgi:hypothetical protein
MITEPRKKIEEFGQKIKLVYENNPDAYKAFAISIGILAGGSFVLNTATKAFDVGKDILFGLMKSGKNHPFLWATGLIAGI